MRTDLNNMTFGIEIECTIPVETLRQRGWVVGGYHTGASIPGFAGWTAQHDGSIRARRPHQGVEVVSPVLQGFAGLLQIELMVAELRAMGARVNTSTGFHVHVGWNGTPEQLRRLICFVAFHEKALFASTGTTSREHNHYCSSIRTRYRPFEQLSSEADARSVGRYYVLNLANIAMGRRRTVEFRVFAGTLNVVKILAYVQLCLGMVQKALDNPRKQLSWDAPMSASQSRQRVGDGVWAMRRMLTHLHWRERTRPGRAAAGVLDPARIGAMKRQLFKMAHQYDGRVAGGGR